jgi:hypothetical protein
VHESHINKFWRNLGSLPDLGKGISSASYQRCGECDSQKQRLNKYVMWTIGLMGGAWGVRLGCHHNRGNYLILMYLSVFGCHKTVIYGRGGSCFVQYRAQFEHYPPLPMHGFRHAGHGVWTGFPSNRRSNWLSLGGDIRGLEDYEEQLVGSIHPTSIGMLQ